MQYRHSLMTIVTLALGTSVNYAMDTKLTSQWICETTILDQERLETKQDDLQAAIITTQVPITVKHVGNHAVITLPDPLPLSKAAMNSETHKHLKPEIKMICSIYPNKEKISCSDTRHHSFWHGNIIHQNQWEGIYVRNAEPKGNSRETARTASYLCKRVNQ